MSFILADLQEFSPPCCVDGKKDVTSVVYDAGRDKWSVKRQKGIIPFYTSNLDILDATDPKDIT